MTDYKVGRCPCGLELKPVRRVIYQDVDTGLKQTYWNGEAHVPVVYGYLEYEKCVCDKYWACAYFLDNVYPGVEELAYRERVCAEFPVTVEGPWRWGHAEVDKPERWTGDFKTYEEAVADGHRAYCNEEFFYVQRGRVPDVLHFVPDVQDVIDIMEEVAYNTARQAAEEFPDVSAEAKTEFEKFIEAWARKHIKVNFWVAVGAPVGVDVKSGVEELT